MMSKSYFGIGDGLYATPLDERVGTSAPVLRKYCAALEPKVAYLLPLLNSPIHDARLMAAMMATDLARGRKTKSAAGVIFRELLRSVDGLDNWDLVDTASGAIGAAILAAGVDATKLDLQTTPELKLRPSSRPGAGYGIANSDDFPPTVSTLYRLATLACEPVDVDSVTGRGTPRGRDRTLWLRRIGVVGHLPLIKAGVCHPVLATVTRLMDDHHDLMHKACGWMLREVGKRDDELLHAFVKKHCRRMPRVMLRYAIERMDDSARAAYLAEGRRL